MLTGVGPDQPRRELPEQFAHSIVPIVVGYVIAHYLTYLLEVGEQTLIYMSDPFSNGSNWFGTANWQPSYFFSYHPTLLATVKVLAVVLGHVLGVIAAHDRAIHLLPKKHQLTGQLSLLVAMICLHRGRALPAVRRLRTSARSGAGPWRHGDDRVGERADRDRQRGLGVGLEQGASGDQRTVDGVAVLGQEVQADRPDEPGDHLLDVALRPAEGRAHPVDHHPVGVVGCGSRAGRPAPGRAATGRPGRRFPTTSTSSATSSAARVIWWRPGRPPRSSSARC